MSSQQADQDFRIEERFGRFEAVGDLTVPKTWSLRFERTGNNANEWKYDMTVQTIEVTGPQGPTPNSQLPIPKAISARRCALGVWSWAVGRLPSAGMPVNRREFAQSLAAAAALGSPQTQNREAAGGSLTDVRGIRVGHFTDTRRPTGCTAILFDTAVAAGVDYNGSAPGESRW